MLYIFDPTDIIGEVLDHHEIEVDAKVIQEISDTLVEAIVEHIKENISELFGI